MPGLLVVVFTWANVSGEQYKNWVYRNCMAVKMMLALSFVHVNDVLAAFNELVEASPAELIPLADYSEDNYIGRQRRNRRGNPRFAIEVWNIHNRVCDNLPEQITQCRFIIVHSNQRWIAIIHQFLN